MRDYSDFFKVKEIDAKPVISFNMDITKEYDEISCGALKLETPEFIMPVTFEKGSGIITSTYTVPQGFVNIKSLTKTLMIEEVLNLYNSVYECFENCTDWYLLPSGFCFNLEQVYIKEDGSQFLFLYIPDGETEVDPIEVKEIFISILEKCEETSGGKIQLQLYRHFYKPTFDLEQFKLMIDNYNEELSINKGVAELSKTEDIIKKDSFVKSDFMKEDFEIDDMGEESSITKGEGITLDELSEKTQDIKLSSINDALEFKSILNEVSDISTNDEWVNPYEVKANKVEKRSKKEKSRGSYSAQPSRSQLSQEEIEEMVKSIYSTSDEEEEAINLKEQMNAEIEDPNELSKSTLNNTNGVIENDPNEVNRRKKILNSVFNANKSNTPSASKNSRGNKSAVLKSISTHTRYDLPKLIKVQFINEKFIIGRATKIGEPTGADYEFGAEITPISRIHAQIEVDGEQHYLRDLGSSNGTFLNGDKIEANKEYKLEDGDRIALAIAFSKNSIEYMFQK